MKFSVKDMDIATGGVLIAILNYKDAKKLDLRSGDRILLSYKKQKTVCIIDISESSKAVSVGKIGLFEEVLDKLEVKHKDIVNLEFTGKPESVIYIREKLFGKRLNYKKFYKIANDITHDRLTDIEKTYFVGACFTNGLNINEIVDFTKAIVDSGDKIRFGTVTLDKHCIGGVPGNRTTMIIVPIIAAAGFTMPKTSSRAITSPAGTADTMECLAKVDLDESKIKEVVRKTKACIVHGGSMNLAPADDKIIEVEHPLSIDAEGQLLASVMAKKFSVTANHVLIDVPVGKQVKARTKAQGNRFKKMFEIVGKKLGMNVKVILTDGSQPIGNGIGPLLESEDVMSVLGNDPNAPKDLKKKALYMAGLLLEMTGKYKNGEKVAREILESGKALEKMYEIIKMQGNHVYVRRGKYFYDVKSVKKGRIVEINNEVIAKLARLAGNPGDKGAGLYLHKKVKCKVSKGDILYTIYAENKFKLELAVQFLEKNIGYLIK